VSDTGSAEQFGHVTGVKDIGDQAIAFMEVEAILKKCGNARRVLPAMLQHGQGVIDNLRYWLVSKDTDNATHLLCLPNLWSAWLSLQITPDPILRFSWPACRNPLILATWRPIGQQQCKLLRIRCLNVSTGR
jgi:hypothetical protein